MDMAFNSLMIVTITHPSVIDEDVQLDLHTRAEPQLLLSPRFLLHWDHGICCTACPHGLRLPPQASSTVLLDVDTAARQALAVVCGNG
jgi:hypothetical protein